MKDKSMMYEFNLKFEGDDKVIFLPTSPEAYEYLNHRPKLLKLVQDEDGTLWCDRATAVDVVYLIETDLGASDRLYRLTTLPESLSYLVSELPFDSSIQDILICINTK